LHLCTIEVLGGNQEIPNWVYKSVLKELKCKKVYKTSAYDSFIPLFFKKTP